MFNNRASLRKPVPAEITRTVLRIMDAREVAFHNRVQDPFGLDTACTSAGGHVFIADGEAIVCEHCSRLVWP